MTLLDEIENFLEDLSKVNWRRGFNRTIGWMIPPTTFWVVVVSLGLGYLVSHYVTLSLDWAFREFGMEEFKDTPIIRLYRYVGVVVFLIVYIWNWQWFWIYTPAYHGRILQSRIPLFFSVPEIFSTKKIKRPARLRAVLDNLYGKWPWEVPDGEKISLVKSTPLDVTVEAQTWDNIPVEVNFTGAMTAIRGASLVNYLGYDEKSAEEVAKSKMTGWIQTRIRSGTADQIKADPKKFFEGIDEVFSGDEISEFEEESGRTVGSLTFRGLKIDKRTVELQQSLSNAKKIREILDIVLPSCNGNTVLEQSVGAAAINAEFGGANNINLIQQGDGGKGKGKR